jgi:endonuclease YncB( thermonuclease family)
MVRQKQGVKSLKSLAPKSTVARPTGLRQANKINDLGATFVAPCLTGNHWRIFRKCRTFGGMSVLCFLFGLMCFPHDGGAGPLAGRSPVDLAPIIGRATVEDGDTITIGGRRVRMQGLDAPEMGQLCEDEAGREWRCGGDAGRALDAMIGGRIVTCTIDARDPVDRYGRALGWCEAGGAALSAAMVRAGWAVAYRRYLDYAGGEARAYKPAILAAEDEARAAGRGIWRGRFDRPDIWRAARRR